MCIPVVNIHQDSSRCSYLLSFIGCRLSILWLDSAQPCLSQKTALGTCPDQ